MIALAALGFSAFTIGAIVSSQLNDDSYPYLRKVDLVTSILAYIFLILFILMAAANFVLMLQIRAINNNLTNGASYFFKEEKFTLTIILVCFGLSYLIRFVWDEVLSGRLKDEDQMFLFYFVYDLVTYFDGMSFAALLFFHRSNFRVAEPVTLSQSTSMNNPESIIYLTNKWSSSASRPETQG